MILPPPGSQTYSASCTPSAVFWHCGGLSKQRCRQSVSSGRKERACMNILTTLQSYMVYPFVRYALIAGVFDCLCSSLLGVTLVLKRFSYIGDGLSHVAFGAMAVATVVSVSKQYGHRHARDHHQRHFAFISKRCDEYPRRRGARHDFRPVRLRLAIWC